MILTLLEWAFLVSIMLAAVTAHLQRLIIAVFVCVATPFSFVVRIFVCLRAFAWNRILTLAMKLCQFLYNDIDLRAQYISMIMLPSSPSVTTVPPSMRMSEHVTKCSCLFAGQSTKSIQRPWFPVFQSTLYKYFNCWISFWNNWYWPYHFVRQK